MGTVRGMRTFTPQTCLRRTGWPRSAGRRLGIVIAAALLCARLAHAEDCVPGDTGDEIDTEEMKLTFEDNFDDLSVSAWGPGTRWIAHTPWSGDFGGARFANPELGFPFVVTDGVLRIEAARNAQGDWRSGLLASVDPKGVGFSQCYGYFETRAQLPIGPGVWPAFWLIGKDRSKSTAEIDVLEFYGDKPEGYSATAHVWHRDGGHYSDFSRIEVFRDARPTDFHTYGVKIDSEFIRMYFDEKLVWKTKTQPEHRQPMYILVNLGLAKDAVDMDVPDPSHMFVDYIRAYSVR
ncbi:glycoside hydrolase family 16 protein [Rhizobium etli]|nr:glycoside hydrolase family 16 protein [Rhizobium etli]